MKATKLTIKLFLIISLFTTGVFADEGHMGGGGLADDGHMGGGGYTCDIETDENCPDENGDDLTDSVLIFVKDYLVKLFG